MWRLLYLSCVVATAFVAALGAGSALHAESITYYLVDYPDDQDGWTLEGHITTNGTIGALDEGDILAWSWTASKDSVAFGCTSQDATASLSIRGKVLADASTIVIPTTLPSCPWPCRKHYWLSIGTTSGQPVLFWWNYLEIYPFGGGAFGTSHLARDESNQVQWNSWWPPSEDRVIAQVPEPGIAVLGLAGVLCVLFRKRRCIRTTKGSGVFVWDVREGGHFGLRCCEAECSVSR